MNVTDAHARTRQYIGRDVTQAPVGVVIGDAAGTPGGQVALLGVANAVARNHPLVFVTAPDAESQLAPSASTFEMMNLIGGATDTSRLEIVARVPTDVLTIGIGNDVKADIYVGADRFTGSISAEPIPISCDSTSTFGAALGSMFAAGYVFRRLHGLPVGPLRGASLWTLNDTFDSTGPGSFDVIDLDGVWLVGAGGVGSSAAWWLHLMGSTGVCTVIDHDLVDITNLNRSLGMFYAQTGLTTASPVHKSKLAAALIRGVSFADTWDAWVATDPIAPNIVIPAANEFGVRNAIASYSHPMAFTGTTSKNWTAELHLYRAGVDSCTACRHPESKSSTTFACATAEVPTSDGESRDASLSFLSGAAGVLTVAGIALAQADEMSGPNNVWITDFAEAHRGVIRARTMRCSAGCARTLTARIRGNLYGATRYFTPVGG